MGYVFHIRLTKYQKGENHHSQEAAENPGSIE